MAYSYPEVKNFNGLFLQKNSFTVPDGALEQAKNVVIAKDGIVTKRRGFYEYYNPGVDTLNNVALYDRKLIAVLSDKIQSYTDIGVPTDPNKTGSASTFTGETVSLSGDRVSRFAQSNKNLYFTTDNGVFKIESSTTGATSVQKAGTPPALDLTATVSNTTTGVFPGDSQVNYRVIFGKRDANDNLLLGAPSDFLALTNSKVTAVSWTRTSNVVTVTSTSHGLVVGQTIAVSGSSGGTPEVDAGDYAIVSTPTADTFTFAHTGADDGSGNTLDYSPTVEVSLEFSVPSEINAVSQGYFYQIYRTEASGSETSDAGTTYKFVDEIAVSGTDISNGFATYDDVINEVLLGAELYTNPNSREGELQANDRPPLVDDIEFYKNHLIYAKATTRHSISLDLIDNGSLSNGDIVEVHVGATQRDYTATTGVPGANEFKISTSTSVGASLRETAQNLVKAINRDSSSLIYARYISSPVGDVPGRMRFQAKGFGDPIKLAVTSGGGDAFSPTLTTDKEDNVSDNEDKPNTIFVSKIQEPEAVPLLNSLNIGRANAAILAIRSLRDSLIVLKEDGVYRVTGDTFNAFSATPLDTTVVCRAPSSVKVLNNQVIFLSNQGVCLVTESSVQIISRTIEDVIQPILSKDDLDTNTSAVAYESERLYLLSTLGLNETTNTVVYAYNILNDTWTTWDTLFTQAVVGPSDTLYMVTTQDVIARERKQQTLVDYTGQNYSTTVNSVASDSLSANITSASAVPEKGDVLVKDNVFTRIASVTGSGPAYDVTFQSITNLEAADTPILYSKYDSTWKLAPFHGGMVGRMKQFAQMQMHFKNSAPSRLEIAFQGYTFGGSSEVEWSNPLQFDGWGLFPWGFLPWGQEDGVNLSEQTKASGVCRVYVPRFAQRTTFLQPVVEHKAAGEQINLQAVTFAVRPYQERVSR